MLQSILPNHLDCTSDATAGLCTPSINLLRANNHVWKSIPCLREQPHQMVVVVADLDGSEGRLDGRATNLPLGLQPGLGGSMHVHVGGHLGLDHAKVLVPASRMQRSQRSFGRGWFEERALRLLSRFNALGMVNVDKLLGTEPKAGFTMRQRSQQKPNLRCSLLG